MPVAPELLAQFTQDASPEFAGVVTRLVEVIDSSPFQLDAAIKWRQLTFAANGDFHHWICAINLTRKFVALNFHFGGLLDDPQGVFIAGASKFMRKLEYRRAEEVDEAVVRDFIRQALEKRQYFIENWKQIQAEG